jgi:hypothetical protein
VEAWPCLRWSSAIARRRQSPPRQMDLPPLSHQALFAAVRFTDTATVRIILADAGPRAPPPRRSPPCRRTQGRRPCTSCQRPGPRTSCACSSPYTTSRALLCAPCLPRRSQARTTGGEAREEKVSGGGNGGGRKRGDGAHVGGG